MNKLKALVVAALFSSLSIAGAASAGEAGSGPNPFTDCGIGAALFSDTKWAAVSSNVIWDLGTTAVASATASPETCSGKKVEVAEFISHSYDNLIVETSKGEGEYLTAMLNIYGCSTDSQPAIIDGVRANTASLVASDEYFAQSKVEKMSNYYTVVNNQAQDCAA